MIDLKDLYHPPDEDYLPFQRAGIMEMTLRPHTLLADDMGLGKTIQTIGYINATRPSSVLISAPNNMVLNWLNELDKWLDPELAKKYEIEQISTQVPPMGGNFIVSSHEGLVAWQNTLKLTMWDVMFVDEIHMFKNRSTKRAQALFALRESARFRKGLTGTPIPNYPYELFPIIHWLDKEQWPSAAAFESRYCPYKNKYAYHMDELQRLLREGVPHKHHEVVTRRRVKKAPATRAGVTYKCDSCSEVFDYEIDAANHVANTGHNVTAAHAVTEKILSEEYTETVMTESPGIGLMVRRLKKEVLPELPRKRRQIIALPAEGKLLELVQKENEMWEKHASVRKELDDILLSGLEVDKEDAFDSMIEGLRQTRRYFFDEISLIRHELGKAKVPYVIEHLENILENKDKLVVFVHHRDVAEALYKHFGDKAVLAYGGMSQLVVEEAKKRFWEDETCELFIGSVKMAGIGINLQIASNIVFAESDWVPGVLTQAEDRCHRIGQEKSLLVQHLVAQDSMDSKMLKHVIQKQKNINKALNRE